MKRKPKKLPPFPPPIQKAYANWTEGGYTRFPDGMLILYASPSDCSVAYPVIIRPLRKKVRRGK